MLYKTIAFFILFIASVSYAQEARKLVQEKMPNYKVLQNCKGNFSDTQYEEDIFALFDPKKNVALYVAVLGKDNKQLLEVKKIDISDKRFRESAIEIGCASFEKVEQLNRIIELSEGKHLGKVFGKVGYTTICVVNANEPAERSCYMYDVTQRKFTSAGGWKN